MIWIFEMSLVKFNKITRNLGFDGFQRKSNLYSIEFANLHNQFFHNHVSKKYEIIFVSVLESVLLNSILKKKL